MSIQMICIAVMVNHFNQLDKHVEKNQFVPISATVTFHVSTLGVVEIRYQIPYILDDMELEDESLDCRDRHLVAVPTRISSTVQSIRLEDNNIKAIGNRNGFDFEISDI